MKLSLLGKDILEIQADICVSTVHPSKNLKTGILSKLILKEGGEKVQEDLKAMSAQAPHLSEGDLIVTESGNLKNKFRYIFFACLAPWDGKNDKEITEVIVQCCKQACGNGLKSIVFPCLGSGGLGFPEEKCSQAMMEGFAIFAFEHPQSSLERIYISLHKKSSSCMIEWDGVFKKMVKDYNEVISGISSPIEYTTLTGTGGSGGTETKQHAASPSLPKAKARYDRKVPSTTTSSATGVATSSLTTGWWSLPTFFSGSVGVGVAQMSATPTARARLLNDGAEVDLILRLKVGGVPWLKTLFARFL